MISDSEYYKLLHDLKDSAYCLKKIKDDVDILVKTLNLLAVDLEKLKEK